MAKPIDRAEAASLWDLIGVTVDKVRIAPRQHKGNVMFLGYADIQVWLFNGQAMIPFLTMCGNSIKLIGEQLHFDPKSERGKGSRSSDFFPHWYPGSGAARVVITRKLSEDRQIQEMIQVAIGRLSPDADAAS